MATFKVEPVGGTSADHCTVYDNGNQQCHLMVSIDLEDIIGRPLTPDEFESMKLASYSASPDGTSTDFDALTLPTGMTTSPTQNSFDAHPDNVRRAKTSAAPKGSVFIVDFFVSCTDQIIGSRRLMAAVKVYDDQNPGQFLVFTTHFDDESGTTFESSVTVTADPSWYVSANELTEVAKQARDAYHNHVWELPSPLEIRKRELEIDGYWREHIDEYLFYRDISSGSIDEIHEGLTSTELSGRYHISGGHYLDFDYTNRQFGAGFVYIKQAGVGNGIAPKDEEQKIRLLDNYGTNQTFILDGSSSGVEVR